MASTLSNSNPIFVPTGPAKFKRLKLGAFIAVLYAYCAAGPFGFEEMVSLSGPGLALLFLLVVPWLFSLPMSLATAEMATAMPVEGGFYRWTRSAWGPAWGFHCGWWNWTGTFLMNGAYAVALADYTAQLFPAVSQGWRHWLVACFFLGVVAVLNILGIQVVGKATVIMLLVVLGPVVVFTAIGLTHMQVNPFVPVIPPGKSWDAVFGAGLALALWLYSGYEQLSTIAEEVEEPAKNFPIGLAIMVPLAMVTFFLPIMAGIGAGGEWQKWTTGYMVTVAGNIGGPVMAWSMFAAAMISVLLGLESTLLSSTRLPFTMAEDGFFPQRLGALHPRFKTPVSAILLTTMICAALTLISLPTLIAIYTWLRVSTSSLTLLSVWRLRRTMPDLPRPYRIPGGTAGLAMVVIIPMLLFAFALLHCDPVAMIWGPAYLAMGPIAYWFSHKRAANSSNEIH